MLVVMTFSLQTLLTHFLSYFLSYLALFSSFSYALLFSAFLLTAFSPPAHFTPHTFLIPFNTTPSPFTPSPWPGSLDFFFLPSSHPSSSSLVLLNFSPPPFHPLNDSLITSSPPFPVFADLLYSSFCDQTHLPPFNAIYCTSSSYSVSVNSKAEEECGQCPEEAEEPGQAELLDPARTATFFITSAAHSPGRGGEERRARDQATANAGRRGGAEGSGDTVCEGERGRKESRGGGRERHALCTDQTRARGDGVHGEEGETGGSVEAIG